MSQPLWNAIGGRIGVPEAPARMPALPAGGPLHEAFEHHRAGRLDVAETMYRGIVAREPRSADALHLLGMVLWQRGDTEGAAAQIRAAVGIAPAVAQFRNNLGLVLDAAGRHDEAGGCFGEAVRLAPAYAEAHANLGQTLERDRRYPEAIRAFREALRLKPEFLEARHRLGCALLSTGELSEAVRVFEEVLARNSDHLEANVNLSSALKRQGRFAEAVRCCRRAIAACPASAEAHANLGAALLNLDQLDEAESACREALRLKPGLAEAYCNLGAILLKKERVEEALACCEEAVRLKPESPEALNNLGNALRAGKSAREYYERALAADPGYFEAWLNLSVTSKELDLHEDALAAGRRAVSLRPESAEAHNNLGNVLRDQGRLEEAQGCFREAIRCRPDLPEPYVNLAGTLKDQGRLEEALAACRRAIELDPEKHQPVFKLLLLPPLRGSVPAGDSVRGTPALGGTAPLAHGERAQALEQPRPGAPAARRLRFPGFPRTFGGVFRRAGRGGAQPRVVEVYCYSNVARPDAVTQRFQALADHWRDIRGVPDSRAAELIREDRIDILVDLAGHTAGSRLLVFARKPAPVQATWCGYPATTGLAAIDYRITDALADPPGETDHLHTERLVRLPGAFLCYGPPADAPAVSNLPARASGHITFGCFNFLAKVTPRIVEAWSALLAAVPGARLVLKSAPLVDESTRRLVWERFRAHGTDPGRVELLGPVTREQHLETYHRIDIALDTFPYHGTTTTFEALWMGVPVVTAAGATHASRVGVSLLENAGLGDWVAPSLEDYVELAAAKARRPDLLADLRAGLRGRLARSPLTDAALFTSRLEEAYRRMWRSWCLDQNQSEVTRSADLLCSRT